VAVPAFYLKRPLQPHGFYDRDEVRLTLRGIAEGDCGLDDVAFLTVFLRWATGEEQARDADDADLVLTSAEFAASQGLSLEPNDAAEPTSETSEPADTAVAPATTGPGTGAGEHPPDTAEDEHASKVPAEVEDARASISRLCFLADVIRIFWTGAVSQPDQPWRWQYTIDRRRLRSYRGLRDSSTCSTVRSHPRCYSPAGGNNLRPRCRLTAGRCRRQLGRRRCLRWTGRGWASQHERRRAADPAAGGNRSRVR
jgi:hypothetical protein